MLVSTNYSIAVFLLDSYKKQGGTMIMRFLRMLAIFGLALLLLVVTACNSSSETGTDTDSEQVSASNTEEGTGKYEEMSIRLATSTPDDHSISQGAYKFKEIVEEKSGGQIKVEVYSNAQLGSLREQTEAAQLGTIEMSLSLVSTVSSFVEDMEVLEYPYLWPDEDTLWQVMDGETGNIIAGTAEQAGFKGLGFWAGGFKVMTNKDNPILSPDDLRGVDVRVIPSRTLQTMFTAWGANPVPIDFTELYNALQQGTVDAQENPVETIYTQKYHEVQDHLTMTNHGYQYHIMLANLGWWDGLSNEVQQLLLEAEEEAKLYARDINMNQVEERLIELEELGLEIHELSPESYQSFVDLSLPLHEELANTTGKEELLQSIYDGLQAVE